MKDMFSNLAMALFRSEDKEKLTSLRKVSQLNMVA